MTSLRLPKPGFNFCVKKTMRLLITLVISGCMLTPAASQNLEIKVQAGANVSFVPDFRNRIYIVDGFVVPGVISLQNAQNPPVAMESTSSTKPGAGFTVEAEIGKKLDKFWKLSLSAGLNQVKFDYDTHIAQSFIRNDFNLSEMDDRYGDTRFLYITSRPLNVTRTFDRFSIQAGVLLDFLVSKKYSNVVVIYAPNSGQVAGAFFEEKGEPAPVLAGVHINARYAIAPKWQLMLAAQRFFTSLYKSENTYKPLHEKNKTTQLQLGISYRIADF